MLELANALNIDLLLLFSFTGAQMINEFNNHFGNLKKHQNLIKSMGEGIRMNPDITVGGYLCVVSCLASV